MPLPPEQITSRQAQPSSTLLTSWAPSTRHYQPAASPPRSREAEPTICAEIPGSARPTVQMGFTTAWCQLPEGGCAQFLIVEGENDVATIHIRNQNDESCDRGCRF